MNKLIALLFGIIALNVNAQKLSIKIQETYHAALGIPDEIHVYRVTNVDPTAEAWDNMNWQFSDMEFEKTASYRNYDSHTWTEQGLFVVFCRKDNDFIGERTFFMINEKYVDYVTSNISGLFVEDTYIRSDVEWIGNDDDKVVIVR